MAQVRSQWARIIAAGMYKIYAGGLRDVMRFDYPRTFRSGTSFCSNRLDTKNRLRNGLRITSKSKVGDSTGHKPEDERRCDIERKSEQDNIDGAMHGAV